MAAYGWREGKVSTCETRTGLKKASLGLLADRPHKAELRAAPAAVRGLPFT